MKTWMRDYGLSLTLFGCFLVSILAQAVFQVGVEGESWSAFAASVAENWQSEFLQLVFQVVLPVYLIHRGSPVSRDGDDRMEQKVNDTMRDVRVLGGTIEQVLDEVVFLRGEVRRSLGVDAPLKPGTWASDVPAIENNGSVPYVE